ncbi:MAG: flagellar hook capping protein [Ruminiclostridium sp.]|nr:flagellar hook capping protein [Ruminiclostridium sp.]
MAAVTGLDNLASPQSNYEKYKDMFTNDKHDLITMDNFYSLLVAEMQNQDPLEPTSNTEFISQMASFTALQAQQDAYNTQKQNYADTLVGKTVTVTAGDGEAITGTVDSVTHGDEPKVMVGGKQYLLSSISQVHDQSAQSASGIGDYGAFAAGILGRTVVVQSIDSMGMTYIDEGVVSSLEIEKGNVRVIVNGYAYDATDIVKVNGPEQAEQTAAADEPDSVSAEEAAAANGNDAVEEVPEDEEDIEDIAAEEAASVQPQDTGSDSGVIETDEDDIDDIYELFE